MCYAMPMLMIDIDSTQLHPSSSLLPPLYYCSFLADWDSNTCSIMVLILLDMAFVSLILLVIVFTVGEEISDSSDVVLL